MRQVRPSYANQAWQIVQIMEGSTASSSRPERYVLQTMKGSSRHPGSSRHCRKLKLWQSTHVMIDSSNQDSKLKLWQVLQVMIEQPSKTGTNSAVTRSWIHEGSSSYHNQLQPWREAIASSSHNGGLSDNYTLQNTTCWQAGLAKTGSSSHDTQLMLWQAAQVIADTTASSSRSHR
jgi:hypothetical protein